MDRAKVIFGHLKKRNNFEDTELMTQSTASGSKHRDSEDDIVIVSAVRTPICKSRRGGLKVCTCRPLYDSLRRGIGPADEVAISSQPEILMQESTLRRASCLNTKCCPKVAISISRNALWTARLQHAILLL